MTDRMKKPLVLLFVVIVWYVLAVGLRCTYYPLGYGYMLESNKQTTQYAQHRWGRACVITIGINDYWLCFLSRLR
jgi:hypothetical protein